MYRKALALAPENPEGLHLLGVALLQSGAPGQAVTAIEKAVKLDPDQADYYDNLGAAHAAMGEFALFLVPIMPDRQGRPRYEALFNRRSLE